MIQSRLEMLLSSSEFQGDQIFDLLKMIESACTALAKTDIQMVNPVEQSAQQNDPTVDYSCDRLPEPQLLESVPVACFIVDQRGLIQVANQDGAKLLGSDHPANLQGISLEGQFLDETNSLISIAQLLPSPAAPNTLIEQEIWLKPIAGDLRCVLLRVNCIADVADVDVSAFYCFTLQDITMFRTKELTLQQTIADLRQKLQSRTIEMQKALDFESTLKRITDKVRDSLDESQILQTVVKELTLVLGLGGCNSALYNLEQGTSTIRYEYISSIPASQGKVAQMDHFPEIYRQLQQGYYFQFCSLFPNPIRGHVAMLACPIFVDPTSSQGMDQAVLGDLWLIHHKDYVFTEPEIRLVQQVANQCAIAIRQARLYQTAQRQVQELEKLNRLKDEFLSTVSHELRTPIANVKMAIQMLKLTGSDARRQTYLEILEAETNREAELIDELLDLQRLEDASHPICVEEIHLQDWLTEMVKPFYSRTTSRQQSFKISYPTNLKISTDFKVLQRILAELLNNACKYTLEGGEICLEVQLVLETSEFGSKPVNLFKIRNQAEIPVEDLPHIFDKFYRVIQPDRYKQGGTGLGLALVQKRVGQLRGKVQVHSAHGWTEFSVVIPNCLR